MPKESSEQREEGVERAAQAYAVQGERTQSGFAECTAESRHAIAAQKLSIFIFKGELLQGPVGNREEPRQRWQRSCRQTLYELEAAERLRQSQVHDRVQRSVVTERNTLEPKATQGRMGGYGRNQSRYVELFT